MTRVHREFLLAVAPFVVHILSSILVIAFATTALAQDWPQWRGPDRTGVVAGGVKLIDAVPETGLPVLWQSEPIPDTGHPGEQGSDVGYSSPVAAGGRVYLYVNQRARDESPLRLPWGLLNRLGCFDAPMPEDVAKKVEAARTSPERAALKSDDVPAWAGNWVARNLSHAQVMTLGARVEDRLIRGAEAIDLGTLQKVAALKDKPFDKREDLEKALTDAGLDADHAAAAGKELTAIRKRALDRVFCFDAETGKTLWKKETPGELFEYGTSSTPCIVGDKIYVSGGRTIYCLSTKDGAEVWQAPCPAKEVSSSPIVADDVLLIQAGALCALDAKDGKLLWTRPEFKGIHASPAVWRKDGKAYAVQNSGLVDLKTGALLWFLPNERAGDASPVVSGDSLVISSMGGMVCYALTTDKPQKELWRLPGYNILPSTPIVYAGHLYATKMQSGPLFCADMATGQVLWTSPDKENYGAGAFNTASCIVADGKVIVDSGAASKTGNDFYIVRANPEKFEMLAKSQVVLGNYRSSTPMVADGRLYIRGKEALVCYDLRAK